MRGLDQKHSEFASIVDLVPTQLTVGMREVDFKRRRWREESSSEIEPYLRHHSIPVILGPGRRQYIIDRHHLTRALHEESVADAPVTIVSDMSALCIDQFWQELENRGCVHPFDSDGNRRPYAEMPKGISDLSDDPFRSLAGMLKRTGGYAKSKAPFSEFRWADFLRHRVPRKTVECDFEQALTLARELARGSETAALPGWLSDHRCPQTRITRKRKAFDKGVRQSETHRRYHRDFDFNKYRQH